MKTLSALLLLMAVLFPIAAFGDDTSATGKPFLSPLFSNNMVLQRGLPLHVWGWTDPGQTVTVQLAHESATATADSAGKWTAQLPPMTAGGPYTLAVSGPQSRTLTNVLIGDVWICSGQSNMQMGIGNVKNAEQEISEADYPQIRLFTVDDTIAYTPNTSVSTNDGDLSGQWSVCTPRTVRTGGWNGFTAAGYFFGRMLYQQLHVPIGLIHTSWGGTIAEAWTSAEALQTMPDFQSRLDNIAKIQADPQLAPKNNPNQVTVLYNGMIAPLIPYGIKGAIWYQGESNAGRAYQYRTLLPTMIRDWRTRWGEGDFPFFIVQLANFQATQPEPGDDAWAELREAQLMTTRSVPKTGMAVIIDIGDAKDIHPKDKQDVGKRLALAALAIAYGKKGEYSGPNYRSMRQEGNTIRLTFDHIGGGLVAKGGKLEGFAVAGEDRHFVWADATIVGNAVVVSSPQVAHPVAVRYAWATNPVCNLYNKADLPASPFRTDDWPGITVNNK
jgi:sialate O-acetylesterase